jgi:hypothetical protein
MAHHPNKYKYLKAPTIEQIEAVVAKAGVSDAQFERHYGLYDGCLSHVYMGLKPMPAKYWHLFFDPATRTTTKPTTASTPITPQHRPKVKQGSSLARLF